MTIQYSSDTKKSYEDYLKQYDADKSGISDWTEYLTNLQLGVKDETTALQKSAYNDISQAYQNYFLQSASLSNKGLASGLATQLDERLYSNYLNTQANVEKTTANKIADLFANYGETVAGAEKQISSQASDLTKLTEAALDWYEQVGKDKKVLDDNMQETNENRYQSLIDLYTENNGELWSKTSDDIASPYTLSGLGHAIIDTAFADEDFAEYLNNYSDKDNLRDIYLSNKTVLQDALNIGGFGENKRKMLADMSKKDSNLASRIDVTKLIYNADDETVKNIVNNVNAAYINTGVDTDAGFWTHYQKQGDVYYEYRTNTEVSKSDPVYIKYLQYLKPQETDLYIINGDINTAYVFKDNAWRKVKSAEEKTEEEKRGQHIRSMGVGI